MEVIRLWIDSHNIYFIKHKLTISISNILLSTTILWRKFMLLNMLKTSEEKNIKIAELKDIVEKDKCVKYERIASLEGKLYGFSKEEKYSITYDSIEEMLYVETSLKCKLSYAMQIKTPKDNKVVRISEYLYFKLFQDKQGRYSFNDVIVDLLYKNQFEAE